MLLQWSICRNQDWVPNNPERGADSQRDEELLQGLVVLLQVSVASRPANNPISKTTFKNLLCLVLNYVLVKLPIVELCPGRFYASRSVCIAPKNYDYF